MKCLSCTVDLGDKASKFCPSCGASTSLKCKGCGTNILESARFCPECGIPTVVRQPAKFFGAAPAMHPVKATAAAPPPPSPFMARKAPDASVTLTLNAMSSRFARYWAKGV